MMWKARFQKAWNDPVGSKVISFLIITLLSAIGYGLKQLGSILLEVNWGSFLTPLVNAIASVLSYSIPLWYLIFAFIAWLCLNRILRRVDFRAKRRVSLRVKKTPTSRNSAQVQTFDQDSPVSTKILEEACGFIAVWARVTDDHNRIKDKGSNIYLLSTAGNDGASLGNHAMATYPNAWAIGRVAPVGKAPQGQWRFLCNGVNKEQTLITSVAPLSPGWRLFTVVWSKNEDFIRFYIDRDQIGQKPFANWPQHVSGNFTVGNWPNNSEHHQFNSDVGPMIISHSPLKQGQLDEILASKPIT